MKNLIKLMCLSAIIMLVSAQSAQAQALKYVDYRIVNKNLAVGKASSAAAAASTWLQISDTGSARASILLSGTDTSKITGTKYPGMLIYSRADSSLRIYNGVRWKKVTITD